MGAVRRPLDLRSGNGSIALCATANAVAQTSGDQSRKSMTTKSAVGPDVSSQKLLLLAGIGYLHCLRAGTCHPDEVYRTLGQPRILAALARHGVARRVIRAINGLDEPAWCREYAGEAWFESAVSDLIAECERLLRDLGPPDHDLPAAVRLFPESG
jgi:hypothetical protein